MQPPNKEEFWEEIISLIEDVKVIPVIGSRVVTTAPDCAALHRIPRDEPAEAGPTLREGASIRSRLLRDIRMPSA